MERQRNPGRARPRSARDPPAPSSPDFACAPSGLRGPPRAHSETVDLAIETICSILVFAYGNPSRGDDALGPLLIERLRGRQAAGGLTGVDLLTDFQLQVEHALDLRGRERVYFADAAASGPAPFALTRVHPERDASWSTHAMSPAAVLRVYEEIMETEPPETWLLAVRGYDFGMGLPPSVEALANLARAIEALTARLQGR